ncbi:hypothetical protein ACQP1S_07850 [Micromonospora matsumotoense]|uniref:hypothetical protein n=1 Tax=Micromonospora matsumotoense TaxID=121616 RepID=UPI003D927C40
MPHSPIPADPRPAADAPSPTGPPPPADPPATDPPPAAGPPPAADPSSAVGPPSPEAAESPLDRYAVATADEPVRIPSWMREPEVEHELTRSERLRLRWGRHGGTLLGAVGALLVLVLVGGLALGGFGLVQRVHDGAPLLPQRGATSPPAPRPTDDSGNSLGPFVATPAEAYAEGAAAVVPPAARTTGPFTAKQVADGLAKVRRALVEGRLQSRMLDGDPDGFLAVLAPQSRDSVRRDLAAGANLGFASRVADKADPGLDPDEEVRARGTMTYRSTTAEGGVRALEITTRFVWVYPFDLWRPQAYPPGAELVTLRDEAVWLLPYPDDVDPGGRGLWLSSARVTLQNASCPAMERGFLALAEAEPLRRRTAPVPTPTSDVYDESWRAGDGEEC